MQYLFCSCADQASSSIRSLQKTIFAYFFGAIQTNGDVERRYGFGCKTSSLFFTHLLPQTSILSVSLHEHAAACASRRRGWSQVVARGAPHHSTPHHTTPHHTTPHHTTYHSTPHHTEPCCRIVEHSKPYEVARGAHTALRRSRSISQTDVHAHPQSAAAAKVARIWSTRGPGGIQDTKRYM